jgi:2-polyprenyl-3-methyl-5-hydroxy-6-metoxy-1,4-benzoquinol methylase
VLTTEPEFYDRAMTDAHEPAMLPLDESPWLEVYRLASWWIPTSSSVLDLGCGTGRFAEQLRRRGHRDYLGLDFSPAAIREARSYVPYFSFIVTDLRNPQPVAQTYDAFTCLETLEHLEDDVGLVERIPEGRMFIFSVPNFGGEAHLRQFDDVMSACDRYGHLLNFTAWTRIGGDRFHIHLYRSTRKEY